MSDVRDPDRDQPLPTPGRIPVQAALMAAIAAIAERRTHGIRKYGRPLETHNGRDALTDAWEESLDLTTYLTQMRLERGDQLPTTDTEQPIPASTITEAIRLIETGPRAVACTACKAPAGLSCRETTRLHIARFHDHRDALRNHLRTALGQPAITPWTEHGQATA